MLAVVIVDFVVEIELHVSVATTLYALHCAKLGMHSALEAGNL